MQDHGRLMKAVLDHSKGAGLTPVPSSGGGVDNAGTVHPKKYHLHKYRPRAQSSGGNVPSSTIEELAKRYMKA